MKDKLKYRKYPLNFWVLYSGFLLAGILIFYSFACAMGLDDGATTTSMIVHFFAELYMLWFEFWPLDELFKNNGLLLFGGLFVKTCVFSLVFERLSVIFRFLIIKFKSRK